MVIKLLGYIMNLYAGLKYQMYDDVAAKKSQLVASYGIDPAGSLHEIAQDFKHVAALRGSNLKNRYAHLVMSHARDEQISDEKAVQIAEDLIEELGFSGCQFTMTRHIDFDSKGHEAGRHYHITLNRVRPDGELMDDSFLGLRLHLINEMLEEKYMLKVRKRERTNLLKQGIKSQIQKEWKNRPFNSINELRKDLDEIGYKSYLTRHGEVKYLTICDKKSPIKFSYKFSELELEVNIEINQKNLIDKSHGLQQ